MSSLIFKKRNRTSSYSLANRVLLPQLRCPRLSPVLLLGVWALLCVGCSFRSSTLVCLNARLFESPAEAANPGGAILLSVSGDSDAPLGSWNANQVTPVSTGRHSAASSMQQLSEVHGEEDFHPEQRNEMKEDEKAGKNEREKAKREQRLQTTISPTLLQRETATFHGDQTSQETHMQQQPPPQLQTQKITGLQQNGHGSLLQKQLHEPETARVILRQLRQPPPPRSQQDHTRFQRLTDDLAGGTQQEPTGSGSYIQTLTTAAAQQKEQQQRHERHGESQMGQDENRRLATRETMHRQVPNRQSIADVKPVFLSSEEENHKASGDSSKQMRKRHIFLEARDNVKTYEARAYAPQYPSTVAVSSDDKNSRVATQHRSPSIGSSGEGGALLETREKSRGIGTILAGAGLSTLLGGLNQYQQGPLAAGPPGSAVPQAGGVPVPAAGAAMPAAAAAVAPGVPAIGVGAPAATPAFTTAMSAHPQSSSGHNLLPITVGIILGLIVLCLIGGCIFKMSKKKKRR